MNKLLASSFDALALKCYYRNEFRHAYTYGKRALELDPDNQRLQDNMKWYKLNYTPKSIEKCAWITLLSDNAYINGVVVLHRSLVETGSKYPLYVAVTDEVSQENIQVLTQLNIPMIHFDIVMPPNMNLDDAPEVVTTLDAYGWHKALCKLHVFAQEQFDKVVFIDADVIVKNNMDELFTLPHMTTPRDCWDFEGQFGDTPSLSSGMMVIEPDKTVTDNLLEFLANFDSQGKMIHDQWIIQEYYKGWEECSELHLSPYYAVWTTRFDDSRPEYYYHQHKIKSIHMIDTKPWRVDKEYFIRWLDTYPIYARLSLQYIDILNFTIQDLERNGIVSSDLRIIN